jgi:hypothetical protein
MSHTVYLVTDQHGLNHRVYFADLAEASVYAEKCRQTGPPTRPSSYVVVPWAPSRPSSYVVVPTVVWDSVAERDACDDE